MADSITCPTCGRTSYNPNDAVHRYCGVCGFHADAPVVCTVEFSEPAMVWEVEHNAGTHVVLDIVVVDGMPVIGPVLEPDASGVQFGPLIEQVTLTRSDVRWLRPHTGTVRVTW